MNSKNLAIIIGLTTSILSSGAVFAGSACDNSTISLKNSTGIPLTVTITPQSNSTADKTSVKLAVNASDSIKVRSGEGSKGDAEGEIKAVPQDSSIQSNVNIRYDFYSPTLKYGITNFCYVTIKNDNNGNYVTAKNQLDAKLSATDIDATTNGKDTLKIEFIK